MVFIKKSPKNKSWLMSNIYGFKIKKKVGIFKLKWILRMFKIWKLILREIKIKKLKKYITCDRFSIFIIY